MWVFAFLFLSYLFHNIETTDGSNKKTIEDQKIEILLRASVDNENASEILKKYERALQYQDKEALLAVLEDNFTLFDCHGNAVMRRDQFIENIQKYDVDEKLQMREYELQDVDFTKINNSNFRIKVIVSGMEIIEYEVNDDGKIVSEKSEECQMVNPTTTGLIDDFMNIAITLTRRYIGTLMRIYHFEEILHPEFSITRCDQIIISRDQLLDFFNYTDGNIVTVKFSDMWITNEENNTQNFSFQLNIKEGDNSIPHSIIRFEAVLVNGKYYLVSENQIKCKNVPQVSGLINENATKRRISKALGTKYSDAIKRKDAELFQRITWENMTVKLYICTKSHHEMDILMRRDDYFKIILSSQNNNNSIDYTDVQGVTGDLLTGELNWSVYGSWSLEGKFEARPNPKTGKFMIISEERWRCLNEQEGASYRTYLQKKMQKLIDEFVGAINTRNESQIAEITEEPFKIGMMNKETIVTNDTEIDYYYAHPKLTVYEKPTIENGLIKFSAKGEWLDNRYFARIVDWKYVLINETRRDWIEDGFQLNTQYRG